MVANLVAFCDFAPQQIAADLARLEPVAEDKERRLDLFFQKDIEQRSGQVCGGPVVKGQGDDRMLIAGGPE
jgi:hypothetical protein